MNSYIDVECFLKDEMKMLTAFVIMWTWKDKRLPLPKNFVRFGHVYESYLGLIIQIQELGSLSSFVFTRVILILEELN